MVSSPGFLDLRVALRRQAFAIAPVLAFARCALCGVNHRLEFSLVQDFELGKLRLIEVPDLADRGFLRVGERLVLDAGFGIAALETLHCELVRGLRGAFGHPPYLIARKNSRTSFTRRSGCSRAAKWPPRGISVQRTRL